MKAQDLRVGNIVWRVFAPYGNERDRWYETIKKLSVDDDLSLPSSYIEPIKLTPEILAKCGFTITPDGSYYYDGVNLYKDHIGYVFKYGVYVVVGRNISTLHQLQNLIHALTGNELEVKM